MSTKNTQPVRKPEKPNKPKWNKEKLACYFYSLAILYYCLQLLEKVGSHVSIPTGLEIASFFNSRFIDVVLQCVAITLMIFKGRK